jgi:hypothetical protein
MRTSVELVAWSWLAEEWWSLRSLGLRYQPSLSLEAVLRW